VKRILLVVLAMAALSVGAFGHNVGTGPPDDDGTILIQSR